MNWSASNQYVDTNHNNMYFLSVFKILLLVSYMPFDIFMNKTNIFIFQQYQLRSTALVDDLTLTWIDDDGCEKNEQNIYWNQLLTVPISSIIWELLFLIRNRMARYLKKRIVDTLK